MPHRDVVARARELVRAHDPDGLKKLGLLPRHDLFFPAIYYPPLTKYGPAGPEALTGLTPAATGCLYVHIPQCPVRCVYCHWVVSLKNSADDIDAYLDRLEMEAALWKRALGGRTFAPRSVLIGGGTPTILAPRQLSRLMDLLRRSFDLSGCRQFSVEAEPGTILGAEGLEKLKVLRAAGADRISMGVQSFDDGVLKLMGRPHDAAQAREAIAQTRRAGFDSVSIDLIYGYAGCTAEIWARTLEQARACEVDAYQLYRLRIVPHGDGVGAVQRRYAGEPERFPELDDILVQKAVGLLGSVEAGYGEHLRRIFARFPRHVSYYLRDYGCRLDDVLGLGVSSWSKLGDRVLLNTGAGIPQYYAAVDAGRLPVDRALVGDRDSEKRRALILPLKSFGTSATRFREKTGETLDAAFGPRLDELAAHGLVRRSPQGVSLTARGAFFADEVLMQFYDRRYLPFPAADYAEGPLSPHRPEAAAAA